MKFLNLLGVSLVLAGLVFILWDTSVDSSKKAEVLVSDLYISSDMKQAHLSQKYIQPIPKTVNLDPDIVELGRQLFHDSRMSEKKVSCSTCHDMNTNGTDNKKVSIDTNGGDDIMNTPTLFNIGLNTLFGWDGRHSSLENQIEAVLANTKHMNGNWKNILERLNQAPDYSAEFDRLYVDGITRDNVKHAIVHYERSLITPDSAFDNYLRGDVTALNEDQKSGFILFKQYGCVSCHQGVNLGGNLFARFGVFKSPFENKKKKRTQRQRTYNLGRYNYTGKESDKRVFRVPSLRNVAQTAPYFHTGGIKRLDKAVKFMAKYQIGRTLSDEDSRLIAEFLRSLNGKYEGRQI